MTVDKQRVAQLFRRDRDRADQRLRELADVYRARRLALGDPVLAAHELASRLAQIHPVSLVALVVHTIMTRAEAADTNREDEHGRD